MIILRNPEFVGLAWVFLLLAGVLYWKRGVVLRRARAITLTPTARIASLLDGPREQRMVEVKGKLVAACPLFKAPYSGRECVFYHAIRQDLIEKASQRIDRRRNRTEYGYLTIEEFRSEACFFIDDGSARIAVDPKGLKIYGHRVVGGDTSIINPEEDELFGPKMVRKSSSDTVREEQILAPDRRVYLLGELVFDANGPCICAPKDANTTSLLSIRTEETILEELGDKARNYAIGITVTLLIAAGTFAFSW
jgi:hypothetical protein